MWSRFYDKLKSHFLYAMVPVATILYMYLCWVMGIDHDDQCLEEIVRLPYSLYSSYRMARWCSLVWICVVWCTYGGGVYLIFMLLCVVIMALKEIVSWKCGYDFKKIWSIRPGVQC